VLSNPADDDPARAAFREPQAGAAAILVHKALHQHDYRHWDYPDKVDELEWHDRSHCWFQR